MTNILVPTDFSQASFRLVEQAIKSLNKEVNIILFHLYKMPSSRIDFIRTEPPYSQMMNDSFRKNCRYLKHKYPNLINKISFKSLRGDTQTLFNHFLDANKIDMIVCPSDYIFTKTCNDSVNPIRFFKKSNSPLLNDFSRNNFAHSHQETAAHRAEVML